MFAEHHASSYHNPTKGKYLLLPPFWIASELLTLGQLHFLIKSLNKSFFQDSLSQTNQLDILAKDFGAFNFGHLLKWIEYTRNTRNYCAHHSRLWNRHLAEPPNVKRNLSIKNFTGAHRVYFHLIMFRTMLKSVGIADNIKTNMLNLFTRYPAASALKDHMGFPPNWDSDSFWM